MHELSVTQSLLEIALRHAERAGARRITRLNLVIGELSSIVGESVQFYWDFVSRDTIAEGAELHFEHVPGMLRCLGCDHTFPLNRPRRTQIAASSVEPSSRQDYTCPACDEGQVVAAGGDDFRLESIEVE